MSGDGRRGERNPGDGDSSDTGDCTSGGAGEAGDECLSTAATRLTATMTGGGLVVAACQTHRGGSVKVTPSVGVGCCIFCCCSGGGEDGRAAAGRNKAVGAARSALAGDKAGATLGNTLADRGTEADEAARARGWWRTAVPLLGVADATVVGTRKWRVDEGEDCDIDDSAREGTAAAAGTDGGAAAEAGGSVATGGGLSEAWIRVAMRWLSCVRCAKKYK